MRVWVVDQGRSEVWSGLPQGISTAQLGDLAHWVEPGDVLTPYTSSDHYASCIVSGAALVHAVEEESGEVTLVMRPAQLV